MASRNVAIILAVSDYPGRNQLPACKHDAALMKAVLDLSGKFDPERTLFLDTNTTGSRMKAEISSFIEGLGDESILELVFYYTGHGMFDGEFFFLPSDYDPKRHHQTALSNSELDNMLRALKPDITIKIIDACYSGQEYIKSNDAIEKKFKETAIGFKTCYFLFSSSHEQTSWQDDKLSDFTREVAKAVAFHPQRTIRYKDIVDYVNDAFSSNDRQHPFYVIQGKYTERFAEVTEDQQKQLRILLPDKVLHAQAAITLHITGEATGTVKPLSLEERICRAVQEEAAMFCTEEEAHATYLKIAETLQGTTLIAPLDNLYTLSLEQIPHTNPITAERKIGEWLANDKSGQYFAQIHYSTEEYMDYRNVSESFAVILGGSDAPKIKKTRSVISGIRSTVEKCLFKGLHLRFEPRLQNLPWWSVWLVCICSKTHLRYFHAYTQLKEKNWIKRETPADLEWRTSETSLKTADAAADEILQIFNDYQRTIIGNLTKRYVPQDTGRK